MPSLARQHAVAVYTELLDAWNRRDAAAFAALFAPDGHVTGFDGSQMHGPTAIASELGAIFGGHPTSAYVAKVRDVQLLSPTVTLLRAIAGMIPPGAATLKPAVNAVQTLVLTTSESSPRPLIVHFQNTPAAFHGRPQLVDAMTEELSRVHDACVVVDVG
jgi:uncharacterized protein (TIGR02246 family)